ncbi:MAG: hypothetical protein CME65_12380 [Halobacteriovoraceae bacterium]|nr:hypothetical protein [Halobacteriovoraceae bacterium]|tara:strand:- start:6659 stop:7549 length:891 start_codon:yes stop_codon:yes gene_type:complete
MIFIFILFQIFLNISDKKLFSGNYSPVINIFFGIISITFLFLPDYNLPNLIEITQFNLYILVIYFGIRSIINLGYLVNQSKPVDVNIEELIMALLFSVNSIEIKGVLLLALILMSIKSFGDSIEIKNIDLWCLFLLTFSFLEFKGTLVIMLLGLIQLAIVFLATSRGRESQLKIVILISILFSRSIVSLEIAIIMIGFAFVDNFISLCDKNLRLKIENISKGFEFFEKIRTFFKLRIQETIVLGPYRQESDISRNSKILGRPNNFKAYLDQYELKGSVIIFGLFCLTLILGLFHNG